MTEHADRACRRTDDGSSRNGEVGGFDEQLVPKGLLQVGGYDHLVA